eukprot:gene27635-36441_t
MKIASCRQCLLLAGHGTSTVENTLKKYSPQLEQPIEVPLLQCGSITPKSSLETVNSSSSSIILLSIVRKPSSRFKSAWQWYEHGQRMGNISLEEFVDNLLADDEKGKYPSKEKDSWGLRFTFLEFYYCVGGFAGPKSKSSGFRYRTGLDATFEELSGLSNKDSVQKRTRFLMNLVRKMAQQKVFLMVCDRFDESVLVLRRMLGLPSISATYDGLENDLRLYRKLLVEARLHCDAINASSSSIHHRKNSSQERLQFFCEELMRDNNDAISEYWKKIID